MFLRRDIILRGVIRRWCIFLNNSTFPLITIPGRKHCCYKKMGKHFLDLRFSLSFSPAGRFVRRALSGTMDDIEMGDSGKYVFDSNDFYEDSLTDVSGARQLLYPDSEHPLVKLLNSSVSVQDVFDVVGDHEADMDACALSQAVVVLCDLQNVFYEVHVRSRGGGAGNGTWPEDVFKDYVGRVRAHPCFERLLELLGLRVRDLPADALACTLLHLGKMGVAMQHEVMRDLSSRFLSLLRSGEEGEVSLPALSWYIAAVQDAGLWAAYMMKDAMPLVFKNLERCASAPDFQLLTTCLIGSHRLLDLRRIEQYKQLVERLVAGGQLSGRYPRAVLKAAYLLNYPPWSHCNCSTVRRLLLLLVGSVETLLAPDLVHLHRVFTSQLEPAELLEEMRSHASRLLSSSDQFDSAHLPPQSELLECVVTFSVPSQKHFFEKLALEHLNSSSFASSVAPLFKVLHHLKTSDVHLCDRFWSLTVKFLQDHEEQREDYRLLKVCYRYMHFNSYLGGTYRHRQFEGHILQWLWEHLSSHVTGLVPSKFSQVASFALAYAGNQSGGHERLLGAVKQKLPDMLPQFSEIDCLNVSRGLQVAMRLRRRGWQTTPQLLWDLASVNSALDDWSLARLRRPLHMRDVNLLMKAYMCRRGASNTHLFHQLILGYENSCDELTSRLVRGISMNLLLSRCLLPGTIDRMAEYIVANNSHVLGETLEKLLSLCYSVGYCPSPQENFLSSAAQVVFRDKERMSGMALLQSALALCFFQHLPNPLIYFIFTVDFMERLDQEVAQCYSKATYPTRVRSYLMQLNRAVCLDCPEVSVPWFHEKYVQQVAAQEPSPSSSFYLDVQKVVTKVVGGREFLKSNVLSPYGYKIDFLVVLGADKRPLASGNMDGGKVSRVAVLLHGGRDYSVHEPRLSGHTQLKQRHLELLGYRVLGIPESVWHSMYMSEPGAKQLFLQDQLFK